MCDEYNTLVKNGTWTFVPRPSDVNLVDLCGYLSINFMLTSVVKSATIRTVLSLAVSRQWPIHQFDIKNAFLNGDLSETVYMDHPPGYASRAGFSPSRCDSSLFIYTHGPQVAYLLIYVDDIILTASSLVLLQQIVNSLHKEFDMIDLGALNYYLGISAAIFVSEESCRGLQYLTFTRPDLSYAVQQICLYMHDLREPHFAALKRIMRYVQGTMDLGLHLYTSATTSLVGYTDADWAGCPSTRRSTSVPKQNTRVLLMLDNENLVRGHPWISVHGVALDKPLDPADVLKNYDADLDESGIRDLMLSVKLKDLLKNYSVDLDECGICDLMLFSDIDNSGTIDYDEFAAATLHFSKVDREDRLFCAFSYFDKDGSGYITRKILDTMGSWSTNGQSRPWMREMKFPNGSSIFLGNRAARYT
nr:hypothetical protein [Tanacetum cinerariifolium]